ncbi:P-loop containing nucleoside triphosphate hydrolase protein [Triangularia setosa]|uniref:P-loop containing nucleoside triphosphate hydrolase protein n=1 Tax=Triangularia setosa TaxID=2587417 RepID=A0AAN6W1B1_9PEZI|nr:P-loop containing nucleoside triphosphate hydrolase protein [Podospora setosa]
MAFEEMSEVATTEPGGKCDVKHLRRSYVNGDPVVTEGDLNLGKNKDDTKHQAFALVSTQNFDKDNNPTDTTLSINSKHILAALTRVVRYYPAHDEKFDKSTELTSPFELLYHHRQELSEEATRIGGEGSLHLNLLLAYLYKQTWAEAETLTTREIPIITFNLLWFVFKPGDLLYRVVDGEPALYWLVRVDYDETPTTGDPWEYLKLDCLYQGHDGKKTGMVMETLKIYANQEFSGDSPEKITSLSVFPLKYHKDRDGVKERLVKRGKRYLELVQQQGLPYHYDGLCRRLKTPPGSSYFTREEDFAGVWLRETATGRVILDCWTFMEDHQVHRVKVSNWSISNDKATEGFDDPTLLCPPSVYGYSLDMRCWCMFSVEKLKTTDWKQKDFDSVLLPNCYGKIIKSLVKHHKFASQARDETALKGKGLIFVLHGPPGTGKTRTAEAIAETTKKPLLLFPTGELGSDLKSIQLELRRLVRYGTAWKAILLIDEADVVLESRQVDGHVSLERNALVAGKKSFLFNSAVIVNHLLFLRQLEYFQGIIFLTSNRAQMFDPAVKSRIHIMLHYPSPDKNTRKLLWEQNLGPIIKLKTLPKCELDLISATETLSEYEMNGREISNTVNSALTIAKDALLPLNLDHLQVVANIWKDSQEKSTETEQVGNAAQPIKRMPSITAVLRALRVPLWVWKLIGPAILACALFQGLRNLWRKRRGG